VRSGMVTGSQLACHELPAVYLSGSDMGIVDALDRHLFLSRACSRQGLSGETIWKAHRRIDGPESQDRRLLIDYVLAKSSKLGSNSVCSVLLSRAPLSARRCRNTETSAFTNH
jgi:hypothetical protein